MKNYAIKDLNGWQNVESKTFLGKELAMTGAEASRPMDTQQDHPEGHRELQDHA